MVDRINTKSSGDVDPRLLQLAEQLGTLLGTARAKADRWLDRDALSKELGRIRDGAADLLAQVNRAASAVKTAVPAKGPVAPPVPAKAKRASRGPVDAPGKKHRKPPPQEALNRRMGEVRGKKVGIKNVKNAMKGRA